MPDKVWRVKHSDPTFTGFYGGVDFVNGVGTSSMVDVICRLIDKDGFRVIGVTEEERAEFRFLRNQWLKQSREPTKIKPGPGSWSVLE